MQNLAGRGETEKIVKRHTIVGERGKVMAHRIGCHWIGAAISMEGNDIFT